MEWEQKVGQVFNTNPRIGVKKNIVWLERDKEYHQLDIVFKRPGAHVCLDGPTGVGKTSLALTYLEKEKVQYVLVVVTRSMNWVEFCRQLVLLKPDNENSFAAEISAGIQNALPNGSIKMTLGAKSKSSNDYDLFIKKSQNWTEHDVASQLFDHQACLVVDNMERANDELLTRLTDLTKLLTQDFLSNNVKVLFIGTNDIYRRILMDNPSLEERMIQTTLGTFGSPGKSWRFLTLGFEKLGLRHPGNSKIGNEFNQRHKCMACVYEAADGLPKSLNTLGYNIATKVTGTGVNAKLIIKEATDKTEENWIECNEKLPDIIKTLHQFPNSAYLVRAIYSSGVNNIHRKDKIFDRAKELVAEDNVVLTEDDLNNALHELTAIQFLIQTGRNGEIVYAYHPNFAHTLGVVMKDNERFKEFEQIIQLRENKISHSFTSPNIDYVQEELYFEE